MNNGLVCEVTLIHARFAATPGYAIFAKRIWAENAAGQYCAVHIPSVHEVDVGDSVWWTPEFVHVKQKGSTASYRSIRLGAAEDPSK